MSRIECSNMKSSVQWLLLFYQLCSSLTLRLCFFPPRPHTLFPTHLKLCTLGTIASPFFIICTLRLTPVLDPSLNVFPGRFSYWVLPYIRASLGGAWPRPPPITWLPEIVTLSSVSFISPPSWGTGSCIKIYCCLILQSKISNLMRCYNSNIKKINFILFVLLYFIIQVVEHRGKDLYCLTNSQQRVTEISHKQALQ